MLSDSMLERVSNSYRRGYRDGFTGRTKDAPANGIAQINDDTIGGQIRPFADFDYDEGYKAGANDLFWTVKRHQQPNLKEGR